MKNSIKKYLLILTLVCLLSCLAAIPANALPVGSVPTYNLAPGDTVQLGGSDITNLFGDISALYPGESAAFEILVKNTIAPTSTRYVQSVLMTVKDATKTASNPKNKNFADYLDLIVTNGNSEIYRGKIGDTMRGSAIILGDAAIMTNPALDSTTRLHFRVIFNAGTSFGASSTGSTNELMGLEASFELSFKVVYTEVTPERPTDPDTTPETPTNSGTRPETTTGRPSERPTEATNRPSYPPSQHTSESAPMAPPTEGVTDPSIPFGGASITEEPTTAEYIEYKENITNPVPFAGAGITDEPEIGPDPPRRIMEFLAVPTVPFAGAIPEGRDTEAGHPTPKANPVTGDTIGLLVLMAILLLGSGGVIIYIIAKKRRQEKA